MPLHDKLDYGMHLVAKAKTLLVSLIVLGVFIGLFHGYVASQPSSDICTASCPREGVTNTLLRQEPTDEEREPTPPGPSYPIYTVAIVSFYLVPVAVFSLVAILYKKYLLTTQLRF